MLKAKSNFEVLCTSPYIFARYRQGRTPPADFGIVDCARDPDKGFAFEINYDSLPCFRTKLRTLWVLPAPEHAAVFGPRGLLLVVAC